ncbi:MAG TPA: hypothetical protein VER04_05015 [Polyangiaceae bacterium]|nr:hypothetical protein [Polyangiaceae bacterium]
MRVSLSCCSLLSAALAFTLVSATGCETDAEGIDDCRAIEQARCEAAEQCGQISDVPACQRFYRDQCLHGLPVSPPGSVKVQACVATIRAAGQCAEQAESGDSRLRDCDPQVTEGALVFTACALVKEPEKAAECSFLTPGVDAGVGVGGAGNEDEDGNAAGAGGQAGSGGESGG